MKNHAVWLVLGKNSISWYNNPLMFAVLKNFSLFRYFGEVREELRRVTWPTRKQTLEQTLLVISASVVVGLYVGLLDYIFTQLTGALLK
jgi:preprotein translocase subunit SecE